MASHIREPVRILDNLLPIQFPVKVYGKTSEECPVPWTPTTHVRDQMMFQAHHFNPAQFWLWPQIREWTIGWQNFFFLSVSHSLTYSHLCPFPAYSVTLPTK